MENFELNASTGVFTYHTQTHFDELDALWILHHSRYLKHLERAQQGFFDVLLGAKEFDPETYPDIYVLVRRVEVDFKASLRGVIPFKIELKVERVREAGLTVGFAFRSPDGATLYAAGKRVVCKMSGQTHQPTGWSAGFRDQLEHWCDLAATKSFK